MAKLPNFEIIVSIETVPAIHKTNIIETAFDNAYKGERGSNETPGEFLIRKLSEHIAAIVTRHHVDAPAAESVRQAQKQAAAAMTIPQRKDKSEAKPELGENDETFGGPSVASVSTKNAKTKRK